MTRLLLHKLISEKITESSAMTDRPRLTPAMADARRMVRESLEQVNLAKGDALVLGVSGGGDSIALAAAVGFEAPRMGVTARAVIVDHGLQSGSAEIAAKAQKTCQELGLGAEVVRVEVANTGQGLEAAARDVRYAALERVRQEIGASWILLGHNLEDQAESVLLGLSRGSGLKSISGMGQADKERRLLRPFLGLSRESLRQACSDQGLDYWDDPHNSDYSFTRVRIRRLLAELETDIGPGISEALSRTAKLAAEAEEFLAEKSDELERQARLESGAREVSYSVAKLSAAHPAVRNKLLHLVAVRAGAKAVSMSQVETISELITNWHGQKSVTLSGITVEREGEKIVFKTAQPLKPGAC